ncbi:MAG: alpha/beta fold hydrolase [Ilumatobacteraceae bacterium]
MITDLTRRFTVDGVDLAYDRWDHEAGGTPFVLCHGFSGSSHDFALHIEPFAASRTVLTVDHRGHGRSPKLGDTARYSLDRIADDLTALIDAQGDGPVDLLGHSMGGAVSLRLTLRRPDLVRSLILMDTSGWSFRPPQQEIADLMTAFMAAYDPANGLPDFRDPNNPEDPLIAATTPADWQTIKDEMAAGFDPYALVALGKELFDPVLASVRDQLGEIACPVTVIVGEHDHPFVDQADALASEVKDGRVVVIPGAYHSPQLTHPEAWAAAVQEHLAR